MYDFKESRGYWKLKEEVLDRTRWKTVFERGFGNCRKTDCGINEWVMNEWINKWTNEWMNENLKISCKYREIAYSILMLVLLIQEIV
jgi:hypothetical protein